MNYQDLKLFGQVDFILAVLLAYVEIKSGVRN